MNMHRFCLFLLAAGMAFAAEGRDIVNYHITAKLLPQDHAVQGHEELTWRNASRDEIRELRFHLYLNAFRDRDSTWAREGGRGLSRLERNGWGWIEVKRLAIAGGADLTKSIRFIHPDDDNADDRTVISVPLPKPVPPGGSISLDIDFYDKLPHVAERTGYHGDFYLVAQWFPKIGVWENDGWNCHQFHALSEFFADYGRYDVSVTVPSNYIVGATGVNVSRAQDAGATTYRFVQADVHEFAWTASPHFIRAERLFDPAREVTPRDVAETAALLGIPQSEIRLKPVRMILLLQPENASELERHFKALATAIKYFGLWYGAYPYETITLVDPPYGGRQAGGMEYPTFITGWTSWLVTPREEMPEGVIVHEFGHQYWYGMVGSNEFEEPWLDEGFTTYSTCKILDRVYGLQPWRVRLLDIPLESVLPLPLLSNDGLNRLGYLEDPKIDDLVRDAWKFYGSSSYGANSYQRAAILLRTLENYVGQPVMARIMRTYFERWRYRHPTSLDFEKVVSDVTGRDMRWFFDRFVFSSNELDYAVSLIRSDKARSGKGYESAVRLRRLGEVVLPVDLRVRFTDGSVAERQWDGQYRWTEFRFTGPALIESAEIDPDHKILLDVNWANNSRTRSLQTAPLAKWTENLLFWAQQLLLTVGGIA
jgi:hypothetical protein